VAQLCQHQHEFAALNTHIVIVSFGTLPAVQTWLKETCSPFDVILDRERTVYRAYALERSFWRSRNLKTRWYYLKAWLSGKKSLDLHDGEDTSQLGGDFIVDQNGFLRLVYPSHDPTDRPAAEELLKVLRQLSVSEKKK
jgi:peroxiredoxin